MKRDDRTQESFNYDAILEEIGEFGRYQLRTFIPLCFPALFFGVVIMSYTFTAAIPRYRCFIEECENRTSLDFEPPWLENVIPWKDENLFVRQCQRYNETQFDSDQCQSNATDADSFQECQEWVYETSIFHSTLVTEFHLTCDNEWQQTTVNTLYMIGMLVGAEHDRLHHFTVLLRTGRHRLLSGSFHLGR